MSVRKTSVIVKTFKIVFKVFLPTSKEKLLRNLSVKAQKFIQILPYRKIIVIDFSLQNLDIEVSHFYT